jgi:hypothetical protein
VFKILLIPIMDLPYLGNIRECIYVEVVHSITALRKSGAENSGLRIEGSSLKTSNDGTPPN